MAYLATVMITPMATRKHPSSWLTLYLLPRKTVDRIICHTRKVCKIIQDHFDYSSSELPFEKETLLVGLKPAWAIGNMNTRFCINKYGTRAKALLHSTFWANPLQINFQLHYACAHHHYSLYYFYVVLQNTEQPNWVFQRKTSPPEFSGYWIPELLND